MRAWLIVLCFVAVAPIGAQTVWDDLSAPLLDGRTLDPSDLLGKVVVLDFWATWCAPCLEELPTLEQAYRHYDSNELLVLGISLDQGERRTLRSWLRRHGVEWPQMNDGRGFAGVWARRFQVDAVPRSMVVNREGKIVGVDLRGPVLLTVLRDLLQDEEEWGSEQRQEKHAGTP